MHLYSIEYRDEAEQSRIALISAASAEQAFAYLINDEDIQGGFGQGQPDIRHMTEIDRNTEGVIFVR